MKQFLPNAAQWAISLTLGLVVGFADFSVTQSAILAAGFVAGSIFTMADDPASPDLGQAKEPK